MNTKAGARWALIISMLIFGTIGVLRRNIALPSGALSMLRGVIGAACLVMYMLISRRRPDIRAIRKNLAKLCISGAFIGLNWMLLFEAYNHTSVATATLCYYMAPVVVMLLSPVVLGEKLTQKRIACVLVAVAGMIPVSGMFSLKGFDPSELRGVLLGLAAAALYGSVILINKRITGVQAMDRTVVQLAMAAIVVSPYAFIVEGFTFASMTGTDIALTLVAGVVHTGAAYAMYFGSISSLAAQNVAIMSYIDPVFALVLSAVVLGESMGAAGWVGAALVLGATMINEISFKKKTEF